MLAFIPRLYSLFLFGRDPHLPKSNTKQKINCRLTNVPHLYNILFTALCKSLEVPFLYILLGKLGLVAMIIEAMQNIRQNQTACTLLGNLSFSSLQEYP